ncbi:cell division protein ZapA [Ruixingdingia sedimenti]|uniref:Cell division protein ZapA n=1 Tax=Ruixingdingia sedimenti TaxID=3073604 RepID=A0ABU1F378_9RHOB|nr:cell division protein ZapA [Xinfangfangia sp. LG-4]MDR5651326.1 cell division protein ZapA [Xinfangfangia sp. LG-4]
MPEVAITIGGRSFQVACQPGEEGFLQSAAALLDAEAAPLVQQMGRMPEGRMLLMAGLMLADRMAGLEDQLRGALARVAELETRPAPAPERIEVPVIPAVVVETLAEIAARTEALAQAAEERLAPAQAG